MRIIIDNKKERELIESMCDVALRAGGIKNLAEVNGIIASIEEKKKNDKS